MTVFNGSALGKAYSAKGLLERCHQPTENIDKKEQSIQITSADDNSHQLSSTGAINTGLSEAFSNLLQQEQQDEYVPYELRKTKKKKNKKGLSQ